MNDRPVFENDRKPNFEMIDVRLSSDQHKGIQAILEETSVELTRFAEPSISKDRVRFIPIPPSLSDKNMPNKGVGTIIDLTVSSDKEYFEDTSNSTYGILAEFMSGKGLHTPLEKISKTSVIGGLKASDIILLSRNQLDGLTTDTTFDLLTQSIYELTGIESIFELGDPAYNYTFSNALKLLFDDLVSIDNSSKLLISEIGHEKIYTNEDHDLTKIKPSPLEYETENKAKLESIEHIRPNDRHNPIFNSLSLTYTGLINLFEEGKIHQEFNYRYFRGMKNKPNVTMSLRSQDFTRAQLRSKLKGLDKRTDGLSIVNNAAELLSQLATIHSL